MLDALGDLLLAGRDIDPNSTMVTVTATDSRTMEKRFQSQRMILVVFCRGDSCHDANPGRGPVRIGRQV
jgi:hypothetical protein